MVCAQFLTTDRRTVPAEWSYDAADPLAVRLVFRQHRGVTEWRFARQLLGAAFLGRVGEGDVHLFTRSSKLVVALRSMDGHITLAGDAEVAWHFLQSTFDVCHPCRGAARTGHEFCAECATVEVALDEALEQIVKEATP